MLIVTGVIHLESAWIFSDALSLQAHFDAVRCNEILNVSLVEEWASGLV